MAMNFEDSFFQNYMGTMYPMEQEMAPDTQVASADTGVGGIAEIPRNKAQEALGYVGQLLTKAGVNLDEYGIDIPVLGRVTLKDLTVGESGRILEDMSYGFMPTGKSKVEDRSVVEGPDGERRVSGLSGSAPMLQTDVVDLLGLPFAGTAAKVAAKPVIKATEKLIKTLPQDLPVGMGIKAVDEIPTGAPINLTPINPATFKPQTEVRAAIDVVASDPINSIYLSQAERSPSLALRIAKPTIIGTGQKNQITVEDVGTVLQKAQLSLYKNKPLDPTNKKDLTKMIDSASAEAEFQLAQPISGANWYDDDVTNAFKMSAKIVPELATDEPLRVLTTAFAASTSYNKRAGENWGVATRIAEHLLKTGKVANRNPDNGKLWGGTTGPIMEQQLKLHEFMMNKMGIEGYAEWLLTPHTVKEIKDMKAASGLYKTIDIPGKATDLKMGSFIIGEKGGAFFLNLNGIKETTADKWFTRTYNRHAGSLTSGNVSEQGLIDAPRNEAERFIMKEWNRGVASNSKLDEQANQAVLWFYEQNLYYNLGVKSAKSESFSDGAKNLLNARGLSFDESELIKSRGSSNAPKVTTEPQSTTGTGSAVGSGEVATTGTESTTVKRAKKAPTKGVQ
jgi:hypothetical protein